MTMAASQVWKQCQMTLAYALTGHKAQGLNMKVTYIGFDGIFGFGLPYTLMTRTPFVDNIYYVGVPPRDVYTALVQKGPDGKNRIDRKRAEVEQFLADEAAIRRHVDAKMASGELSTSDSSYDALVQSCRERFAEWLTRLTAAPGVKAMCEVSENFRHTVEGPALKGGRPTARWRSLGEVLQQDDETRRRILFYREIATQWMEHESIDVLRNAQPGIPLFPRRASAKRGHKGCNSLGGAAPTVRIRTDTATYSKITG